MYNYLPTIPTFDKLILASSVSRRTATAELVCLFSIKVQGVGITARLLCDEQFGNGVKSGTKTRDVIN